MVTIYNGRAIKIAWTIYKGVSAVKENFDRANVVVFLIDHRGNKINVGCRQEMGTLYVDIPAGALREGIYSIELLWAKNRDFTRPHNWEIAPWVLNHTFLDSRNIVRCLKEDLFAVTEYEEEESSMIPDEGTVVIKAKSSAATYGYDGLDAYEMSVVFGYTTLSRDEWLDQLNNPQTWFMRYLSELIRLNHLIAPGANTFTVTKVAGDHWEYEPAGEETVYEGLPYQVQVLITSNHYKFNLAGLQLTMGGYPITNETKGVTIALSEEDTILDITIERVSGSIRIEPSVIADLGTIELNQDNEFGQNPRWLWHESVDAETVLTKIENVSYDAEVTAYFELRDADHYELPEIGGMSYVTEDEGGGCDISYSRIDGTDVYEVVFTHVVGDVSIDVALDSLEVEVDTSQLNGFDVKKFVGEQEVNSIYKNEDVTIKVKKTNEDAYVEEAPKYKVGDGTPQSFGSADANGWYSVTLTSVQSTIYLSGNAYVENGIYWGDYLQDTIEDDSEMADIALDLYENRMTLIDDSKLAGRKITASGQKTPSRKWNNTFFVAFPNTIQLSLKLYQIGNTTINMFDDGLFGNNGENQQVFEYHGKNYVIWEYYNNNPEDDFDNASFEFIY